MKLKILGSSSAGNCYILDDGKKALVIECGILFHQIKKALDFDLERVVGILLTHSHKDHCKGALDACNYGMNIYTSAGTRDELIEYCDLLQYRVKAVQTKLPFSLGEFRCMAFDVQHDTKEPVGFLIDHPQTGTILFLTDTVYAPYRFAGLSQVIVEANYCEDILEQKRNAGTTIEMLRDRVIESHMSFQNTKELLKANDLTQVHNIVLIHLSNAHSDAAKFKRETEELTGKQVTIADRGVEINFDINPF